MKKIISFFVAALFCFSLVSLQAKTPKKSETVVFNVHLHCADCVKKVNENIAFEKGVTDLKVSLDEQTVAVSYNPDKTSPEALKKAIEKLGYEVKGANGCKGGCHKDGECKDCKGGEHKDGACNGGECKGNCGGCEKAETCPADGCHKGGECKDCKGGEHKDGACKDCKGGECKGDCHKDGKACHKTSKK